MKNQAACGALRCTRDFRLSLKCHIFSCFVLRLRWRALRLSRLRRSSNALRALSWRLSVGELRLRCRALRLSRLRRSSGARRE